MNDMSHLMGTLTRGAAAVASDTQTQYATVDSQGFLAWGNANLPNPSGNDLGAAEKIFRDWVIGTAEAGCGFENQLEGWFRFLIDPVPPILPLQNPDSAGQVHRIGSDDALLAQRAAFLRPDSLVAIVMLTDENDCSVRDTDVGWVNYIPRSDNSAVFIAGIVGVPWQDIGYMDANGNLVYIPVTDPAWTAAPVAGGLAPTAGAPNGIWANIYGDDNQNILPQTRRCRLPCWAP